MELLSRPVAFQVFTATISGVSGFTSIFVFADEVAKWRDADTGANPAREVLASIRPTMATMPNAHRVLSSSPLGTLDAHATAYDAGETPEQCVAHAPSWVANPTLSEESTHIEEPDEAKWRREFAGIPLEGNEESLISAALLDAAAIGWAPQGPRHGWSYVAAMDPATRGNGWCLAVATDDGKRRILVLHHEWRGTPSRPLDPERVFAEMATLLRPFRVKNVTTDQWAGDALAAIARRKHKVSVDGVETDWPLTLIVHNITAGSKLELFEDFARVLADHKAALPADKTVRSDLLGVRRRITTTGQGIRLADTPDGRHSDYAQPVAMVCSLLHCAPPRAVPETPDERLAAHIEQVELKRYGQKNPSAFGGLKPQRKLRRLPR